MLDFAPLAQQDLRASLASAALAGVLCHLTLLRKGEWHLHGMALTCLFVASQIALSLYFVYSLDSTHSDAIKLSVALGSTFLAALSASVTVYRLAFHRLGRFPGPKTAALSKLWHAYYNIDGKGHILLDDMHKQYGDFVRTGPTEIAVFHPDILAVINDTHKNGMTKPAWYDLIGDLGGLNLHRNVKKHSVRRRIWHQALSQRTITQYRPALRGCLDQLRGLVLESDGKPIDFSECLAWFAWDFMGMFSFSESFDMMKNAKWSESIALLRNAMYLLAPATPIPWAFHMVLAVPVIREARIFHEMLRMGIALMDNRIKADKPRPDISEHLIKWSQERGTLDQDLEALRGDGITMMIAGSDTTSLTLTFVFYFLAKDPYHVDKLRAELETVKDPSDPDQLASLPYLNGLIQESLRLFPAIPTAGIRETSPEGLMVGDTFIPGNTVVYAPRYTLGRLESCFGQPNECIPERWSSRPELIKNKNAYAPFSGGMYACVGKGLAFEALRLVTATIIREFDIKFATSDGAARVEASYCDNLTAIAGDLELIMTKRT